MQLNEFEKDVAKNINNYPSKIDTESLWNKVEIDLDLEKKKKNKKILILLLILLGLCAFSYILGSTYFTRSNEGHSSTFSTGEMNIKTNHELGDLLNQELKTEASTYITNSSSIISKNSINNNSSKTTVTQESQKQQNTLVQPNSDQKAVIIKSKFNLKSNPSSSLNPISIDNQRQQIAEVTRDNIEVNNIGSTNKLNLFPIDYLMMGNSLDAIVLKTPKQSKEKKWRLSIAPSVSAFYTDRAITSKDIAGANLKNFRNNTEKSLETMGVGLGIELKHRSNFFINLGLNLNQLTEQFYNRSSEFTTEDVLYIREQNYMSNGDVEELKGTYEQSQEIITITGAYNTLRFAEFTGGGGYRFTNKRLQVGFGCGLMWGVMLRAEGKILDTEKSIIEIENQSSNIYRSNLGYGGYANLEVSYAIGQRAKLFSQFGYKYYANSFTDPNYPLDITYQWTGGTVGLNYTISSF